MCSKQDFQAIAAALAKQVYKDKLHADGQGEGIDLNELVEEIEDHFARKHGTFNRDLFESAVYAPVADRVGLQREF